MRKTVEYIDGNKVVSSFMMSVLKRGKRFKIYQAVVNGQNCFDVWRVTINEEDGISEDEELVGVSKNMRGARRIINSYLIKTTLKSIRIRKNVVKD